MATLNYKGLTLLDHVKRSAPDGSIAPIGEVLTQSNEIIADMPMIECNNGTAHKVVIRTGLPETYFRMLNQPVPSSKSTTAQVTEATGMLEAWSQCDVKLAQLNGDVNAFRASEAVPFIESMGQKAAKTMFYGNSSVNPEQFNGLAVRYSDLSAANGKNIIDAKGTGTDNTSVWLVCWGDQTVHGLFPKGSKGGLSHQDLGMETSEVESNSLLRVYRDQFNWDLGLSVKDWRYAVRVANIDITDLIAGTGADLSNLMINAIHTLPNLNMGKCAFYMNRTILNALDIQRRRDVSGAGMQYAEVDGKWQPSFRGIPLRTSDALLETEERVV